MFLFKYPLLPLFVIILSPLVIHNSFIESYVEWVLIFLSVRLDSSLSSYVEGLQRRNLTLELTAYNLHGWLLFQKAIFLRYRGFLLTSLLKFLPLFLKVPFYKALFLFLLLPLPIYLAISLSVNDDELGEEEAEEDLSDDEEEYGEEEDSSDEGEEDQE